MNGVEGCTEVSHALFFLRERYISEKLLWLLIYILPKTISKHNGVENIKHVSVSVKRSMSLPNYLAFKVACGTAVSYAVTREGKLYRCYTNKQCKIHTF